MKRKTIKQYSKKIINAMVILWFAGAVFGAVVIVVELICFSTIHLPELLTYIGAPMGCGIVGYLAKSAFENKEKIKQNYIEDYDNTSVG